MHPERNARRQRGGVVTCHMVENEAEHARLVASIADDVEVRGAPGPMGLLAATRLDHPDTIRDVGDELVARGREGLAAQWRCLGAERLAGKTVAA
jgi:hypothetical protein